MHYRLFFLFIAICLLTACDTADKQPEPTPPTTAPSNQTMDSISRVLTAARELQDKLQYNEALAVADAIIKKYPGQLDALTIKSEILKAQHKEAEALAVLEQAYALQTRDKELAYDLAYAYAEAKNSKALALTDTLLKYDKTATVARAWYIKALYFLNNGAEKDALRYFDSSIGSDYHFLDAYLDKGQLLLNQKQYNEAMKTFATGQKLAPAAAEFYFWMAKTDEAVGNKTDAKTNYKQAYALDKTMTEAKEAADRL